MKERVIQVLVLGLVIVLLSGCGGDRLNLIQRKTWKDNSLAALATRTADAQWVTNELARVKSNPSGVDDPEEWLSAQMILMRNGDWLAYTNVCQKENARIPDLFLAHGSDGRWYFSTYHFCKQMLELRMDGQPADLSSFVAAYSLKEFDGKSDDCLQKTWPIGR